MTPFRTAKAPFTPQKHRSLQDVSGKGENTGKMELFNLSGQTAEKGKFRSRARGGQAESDVGMTAGEPSPL